MLKHWLRRISGTDVVMGLIGLTLVAPIVKGTFATWGTGKYTLAQWQDLFSCWHSRFERMERSRQALRGKGSAAITREAYLFDEIRTGALVGWIFNNEQEGYQIK